MTKGRMLHGILPFFCAAALLLRSRVRSSNSAAAVGVQTHRAAEVGHGARVIRLVAALGLSKAYFDVLLLLLRDDGVRVDRLVDQSPSFFPHGGLAAVLQGDGRPASCRAARWACHSRARQGSGGRRRSRSPHPSETCPDAGAQDEPVRQSRLHCARRCVWCAGRVAR